MADVTAQTGWFDQSRAEPLERTRPALTTRRMPVFIGDAVIPLRGETLLSLMLKADLQALEDD